MAQSSNGSEAVLAEIATVREHIAELEQSNRNVVDNLAQLQHQVGQIESQSVSQSQLADTSGILAEHVQSLAEIKERLITVEARVQASIDFTDDLVGTANNVLAQADTVLTFYLLGITLAVSAVGFGIQYVVNRNRKNDIAAAKEEHLQELQQIQRTFETTLADKVAAVEQKFVEKLDLDESFLDSLTGSLIKSDTFTTQLTDRLSELEQPGLSDTIECLEYGGLTEQIHIDELKALLKQQSDIDKKPED